MDVEISIDPTKFGNGEFANVPLLGIPGVVGCRMDIDFSPIYEKTRSIPQLGADLLFFAGAVYSADKAILRKVHAKDRWSRKINLSVPLVNPMPWVAEAERLGSCISFLTGDEWQFSFEQATAKPYRKRMNRTKKATGFPVSPVVSLFSGGLDSFVGAVNVLEQTPESPVLLVSHYDGKVAGPKSDQKNVLAVLRKHYGSRVRHFQTRLGVACDEKTKFETSFRSRSLVFLALAYFSAEKSGSKSPIEIPENGAIALNYPLNPSRRGACSTRTVHPYFLRTLESCLRGVGFDHSIRNPLADLTKGEVNEGCENLEAFIEGYKLTNSCSKSGHKRHWTNRKAKACGICVPCLFRRASLHKIGLDDEVFGNEAIGKYCSQEDIPADVRSLVGFIRCNPDRKAVMRSLASNGSVAPSRLSDYAKIIERMRAEVRTWMADKGSATIKQLAGI